MTIKIQHKRSAVAGKAPLPADLDYGEIGVNYEATDPALYIKDSADAIRKIGNQPDASETVKGIVELATAAETTAGTDATRAVHPQGLKVELDKKVNKAGDTMTGDLTVPSLNGGQLAGMRNVLINGDLRINQRGVTIAAAAVGQYGPDRWKKVDATHMTQIVEDMNFVPGATYTLSWRGGTPQQLTAPATGHWTLPNIPITATEVQLELGTVATPFERRFLWLELLLCRAYFANIGITSSLTSYADTPGRQITNLTWVFPVSMRVTPTLDISFGGGVNVTIGTLNIVQNGFTQEATAPAAGYCAYHYEIKTANAEL